MKFDKPRSLGEALSILADAELEPHLLAGGTDLLVEIDTGRTAPPHVVDIWGIPELHGIQREAEGVRIGSLTTCTELYRDARTPDILRDAAWEVGAEQIRNRATIGGNLGTASPAADLTPVLFALGATVRLCARRGDRDLSARQFITGYRSNALRPSELIHSVWIPDRPDDERRAFRKVGTRRAQSISKLVVAVAFRIEGEVVIACRGGAGSVAPRTIDLPVLTREILGRRCTPERIAHAARMSAALDCAPVDDVRSTALYRREVFARVLVDLLSR